VESGQTPPPPRTHAHNARGFTCIQQLGPLLSSSPEPALLVSRLRSLTTSPSLATLALLPFCCQHATLGSISLNLAEKEREAIEVAFREASRHLLHCEGSHPPAGHPRVSVVPTRRKHEKKKKGVEGGYGRVDPTSTRPPRPVEATIGRTAQR
jgi:uncharacterized Zn-finger protein